MRICLCVDVETQQFFTAAPQFNLKDKALWEINKLRRYRYAEGLLGFSNLVSVLRAYKLPATFFIVEQLKSQAAFIHKHEPQYDIGSHGYSHKPLTLMQDAELVSEISKCSGTSFGAPNNMLEDVKYPARVYNVLSKKGFKIVRWVGTEDGIKQAHKNGVSKPFKHHGLLTVQGSMYFEGTSDDNHMTQVLYTIESERSKQDEYVFVLSTHDFTHKNTSNLYYLLNLLSTRYKFVSLAQLVKEAENGAIVRS